MKLLLLNPPHPAIGSRIPREHLPPLGLLALGGPLADSGHSVQLLDAEFGPLPLERIVRQAVAFGPDAVLLGHSGSSSAHPGAMVITRALRQALPRSWIVYGGVFPTFYWREILEQELSVDFVVRGEGEETIVRLMRALEQARPLAAIAGIAFRRGTEPGAVRQQSQPWRGAAELEATAPAAPVAALDACRIGWELIDHRRYTYWGGKRAVVVQFSRGCPHQCNYCGQRVFWPGWRHRDPVRFAGELARLHREQGVEVVNFADENPTASRAHWKAFLEALVAQNVNLILVGSTRAGDIVRDADLLPLYRRAGVARFLLGIESTSDRTLQSIRKDSSPSLDRQAIRLLQRHGIIAMAAWVADFAQETDLDYWRSLRQLLAHDPDQIQVVYATPHRWTAFAQQQARRRVIQTDLRLWDYKHQVLENRHLPPWRILLWIKLIEAVCQLRPRALRRLRHHPDPAFRAAMAWYYRIGRRVWVYELWHWLFKDRRRAPGPALRAFLDNPAPAAPAVARRLPPAASPCVGPQADSPGAPVLRGLGERSGLC